MRRRKNLRFSVADPDFDKIFIRNLKSGQKYHISHFSFSKIWFDLKKGGNEIIKNLNEKKIDEEKRLKNGW